MIAGLGGVLAYASGFYMQKLIDVHASSHVGVSTSFFLFNGNAKVTFLPLLNEPCSFDLLVYTGMDAVVPKKWEDSDPRYIMNSQEVKLRSFTTSVRR